MVNEELLRRGQVTVEGDPVQAHLVASQITLDKAVKRHDISKVFTFHRTVASAKSFTQTGSKGVTSHLPDFEAYHVNGAMPTAHRERIMSAFRDAKKAVMSNARCLSEGVDVPAVDMVAFLSPKRSRIDIIQATGRAMRKQQGKTTGYVLVPLLVEQAAGESIHEAIERTEFDEVWGVLQALQEQDVTLAENIRQMRIQRGRTGDYDDLPFIEKISILAPELPLQTLRRSIATACINKLGFSWDENYGELIKFKEKHGHCNVATKWHENPSLGTWVQSQRTLRKKGKLSQERIQLLDEIGIRWDTGSPAWDKMFSLLKEFKESHGHCEVPHGWAENPKLASWVITQRRRRKKALMSQEQSRRLDEIGLEWDPVGKLWEKMYSALVEYKKRHGDCDVPKRWSEDPKLGRWVVAQRGLKRKGRLSEDRIRRLDKLGFIWKKKPSPTSSWKTAILKLKEFKKRHGHCNVPKWSALWEWAEKQHHLYNKGQLTQEQVALLHEVGFFQWKPALEEWKPAFEDMFRALLQFKSHHGHCDVPEDYTELAHWVQAQRDLKASDQLSETDYLRLCAIGFVWDPSGSKEWEEMYSLLVKYKFINGHCNVPKNSVANPALGKWVDDQRASIRENKLTRAQIKRLEDLGLVW
jgi:hypothetical protein